MKIQRESSVTEDQIVFARVLCLYIMAEGEYW